MPSVLWLQALALEALKRTEYVGRAHLIPYDNEMLQEVQFSLHHSPLLDGRKPFGSTENMVRYVHHYDRVVAYKAVTRLCKKLRLKHREYRLPYGTPEPQKEWVFRDFVEKYAAL